MGAPFVFSEDLSESPTWNVQDTVPLGMPTFLHPPLASLLCVHEDLTDNKAIGTFPEEGSHPPEDREEERRRHERRNHVVEEVVESERTYVRFLQTIVQEYLQPLQQCTTPVLSREDQRTIFSNIELIASFNASFLVQLESRMAEWSANQKIGDVFLTMSPFFRVYTAYVQNFNDAVARLAGCMRRSDVREFFQACHEKSKEKERDLVSLLVMPVQRVPRYALLLGELLKTTKETHSDYENIVAALEGMKGTTNYINEKVRDAESMAQVMAIQERLYGKHAQALVQPSRRFVMEGSFSMVRDNSVFVDRHVYLFSDLVVLVKPLSKQMRLLVGNKEKVKTIAPLLSSSTEDVADTENLQNAFLIHIAASTKPFLFFAASSEEKRLFISSFQECLEHVKEAKEQHEASSRVQAEKKARHAMNVIGNFYEEMGSKKLRERLLEKAKQRRSGDSRSLEALSPMSSAVPQTFFRASIETSAPPINSTPTRVRSMAVVVSTEERLRSRSRSIGTAEGQPISVQSIRALFEKRSGAASPSPTARSSGPFPPVLHKTPAVASPHDSSTHTTEEPASTSTVVFALRPNLRSARPKVQINRSERPSERPASVHGVLSPKAPRTKSCVTGAGEYSLFFDVVVKGKNERKRNVILYFSFVKEEVRHLNKGLTTLAYEFDLIESVSRSDADPLALWVSVRQLHNLVYTVQTPTEFGVLLLLLSQVAEGKKWTLTLGASITSLFPRDVLQEGILEVKGRTRFVKVTQARLFVYKDVEALYPNHIIPLENARISLVDERGIHVRSSTREVTLRAANAETRTTWHAALCMCVHRP